MKPADKLTVTDFEANPIWEFVDAGEDDTAVRPVRSPRVRHLLGRIVGTKVTLANGATAWAVLRNISLANPDLNKHLLMLSVQKKGKWFHLARYHDPDFKEYGASALARFLGMPTNHVFPIRYDLRSLIVGMPASAEGLILEEPEKKLTRREVIRLAAVADLM